MLDCQLSSIHDDHVCLLKRYRKEAVEMLSGNPVEFHIAAGIEDSKEPAVHRLDEFIGPRYRADAAAAVTIECKAGLLKHIQPLHFFMPIRRGQAAKTQRDEAVHGDFQALIELPMDALDAKNLGYFPTGEGDRLGKVVLEGEYTQSDEN